MWQTLEKLFDAIHIIGATFEPRDKDTVLAFRCFFYSLAGCLPFDQINTSMEQFLKTNNPVDYTANTERALLFTYLLRDYVFSKTLYNRDLVWVTQHYKKLLIDKDRWGQSIWFMIHFISKYLPNNQESKRSFKALISCLQRLLPCSTCRKHMADHLSNVHCEIDKYIANNNCFAWSVVIHNDVNKSLNKPNVDIVTASMLY